MQRFFFHITYGETTQDRHGTELPSFADARAAAVQVLGEMLRVEGDNFWSKPDLAVTVANADLTLWTLSAIGQEAPVVSDKRSLLA